MTSFGSKTLVAPVLAAAAFGLAAPAQALSISVQQFTPAAYNDVLGGFASTQQEGFELVGSTTCGAGSSACETTGPLVTSVGTFATLGGTGTGGSVVGGGTQLSLKTAASGNTFGRSNTTPGGAWWLDSNDTWGMSWSVNTGAAFDAVAFVLSDVADVGATLSVWAQGQFLGSFVGQPNGGLSLVLISFGEAVPGASIELRNNKLNDGFSIDDAIVGTYAPVPLPAAGLLLLGGLGGLAALRRRRRI